MLQNLFILFLRRKPESDKMLQEPAQEAKGRKGQQVATEAETSGRLRRRCWCCFILSLFLSLQATSV